MLQFPFKSLWEVCCSWRASSQAPAPWAAGELESTALLRPAKLSLLLPWPGARDSPCPAQPSARQPISEKSHCVASSGRPPRQGPADPCPAAAGPRPPPGQRAGAAADVQQGRAAENLRSSDRRPDKGLLGKTLPRALGTIGGNVSPAPEYSSQPGLQNRAKPGSAACCHPAVSVAALLAELGAGCSFQC